MAVINFKKLKEVSSKEISKKEFSKLLDECGVGFYGFENLSFNDMDKFESHFTNASFSIKNKIITLHNLSYEWEN